MCQCLNLDIYYRRRRAGKAIRFPRRPTGSLQRAIMSHRVFPRGGHREMLRRRQCGRFQVRLLVFARGGKGRRRKRFLALKDNAGGACAMSLRWRGAAEEVRTNSLGRETFLSTCVGGVASAGFDLSPDFDDCGVGLEVGADLDEAGSEHQRLSCAAHGQWRGRTVRRSARGGACLFRFV
jgi:hypothetical protein